MSYKVEERIIPVIPLRGLSIFPHMILHFDIGRDKSIYALEEAMEELSENELMNLLIEGPKLGVDFYFLDKAKTSNKIVGELESIESQLDLLFNSGIFGEMDDISEDEYIERLKND